MTIVDRIRRVMEVKDIRQKDLVQELQITSAYANQIANGKVDSVSSRIADDFCRKFKINFAWLKTGEGPMEMEPTLEEALARLSADVLADEPDSFRARLVEVLADLSADEWRLLEGIASKLAKKEDQA